MNWVAVSWFAFYFLSFATIVRIFARANRTPTSRLAWAVVVIALPIVGILGYIFFGEVKIGRKAQKLLPNIMKEMRTYRAAHFDKDQPHDTLVAKLSPEQKRIFDYGRSMQGFGVCSGNRGELMASNEETKLRMIADMNAAQSQICIMYYIWLDDHTGTEIANTIISAAKRGVACRVLVDAVGSRQLLKSPLWQAMLDAGVDARAALPFRNALLGALMGRLDLRNHRKITLIDNKITYCGSQNCADAAFLVKEKFAPWVDVMMRFEGPIVHQNQLLFLSDWMLSEKAHHLDLPELAPYTPQNGNAGFVAQLIGCGPTERFDSTPEFFQTVFANTATRLDLVTPYFVPNETLLSAITSAAYRGVKLRFVMPARNDSKIVAMTAKSYYRKLLEAGVEIYEYRLGLLHSKIVIADEEVAMVGSTNLDRRSFDLNYENNIVFADKKLAGDLGTRVDSYIANSDRVELETVKKWPLSRRIVQNFAAMLSPIF